MSPTRLGCIEAMLNSLSTAITAPLVVPLAAAIGASDWQVGILTALPLLGMNLSQVPAARLGSDVLRQSTYYLLAGGLGRVAWLVLAASMLLGHVSFVMLLAVVTLASVSSGLQTPPWTAFLGSSVTEDQRGSYFGTRNLLAGACGLAGAFVAAFFVSRWGFDHGNGFALILAVFASAAAAVAMAWAAHTYRETKAAVKEVEPCPHEAGTPRAVWRGSGVGGYVVYGSLLILGAGMATPFYSLRFINDLAGSPQVATTTVAVANATVMLAQGLWGRVLDRVGLRLIGGASLAAIAAVPLVWAVATVPMEGVGAWLLNGVAWAACGLATFNLMLAMSNDSNRVSVVAWVNTLQSPVNFAAPLLGGAIAARAGMQPLFALSSAVLVASLLCFLRIAPTRRCS